MCAVPTNYTVDTFTVVCRQYFYAALINIYLVLRSILRCITRAMGDVCLCGIWTFFFLFLLKKRNEGKCVYTASCYLSQNFSCPWRKDVSGVYLFLSELPPAKNKTKKRPQHSSLPLSLY